MNATQEHPDYQARLLVFYVINLSCAGHVAGPLLQQKREELEAEKVGTDELVETMLDYAAKIGLQHHVREYLETVAEVERELPTRTVRRWLSMSLPDPYEAEKEAVRLLRDSPDTMPLQKYLAELRLEEAGRE